MFSKSSSFLQFHDAEYINSLIQICSPSRIKRLSSIHHQEKGSKSPSIIRKYNRRASLRKDGRKVPNCHNILSKELEWKLNYPLWQSLEIFSTLTKDNKDRFCLWTSFSFLHFSRIFKMQRKRKLSKCGRDSSLLWWQDLW